MGWDVHAYEPGTVAPARIETFDAFAPAFARARALHGDRLNGWHIHAHAPGHAHAPAEATQDRLSLLMRMR
jgi:hypothetical protein